MKQYIAKIALFLFNSYQELSIHSSHWYQEHKFSFKRWLRAKIAIHQIKGMKKMASEPSIEEKVNAFLRNRKPTVIFPAGFQTKK